jgi:uncharacterized RDD family membrane protein YckC/predicted Ser/Thr protein kinase
MNTIRLCPGCAAPLPNDAPGGLCPQCLLKTQVINEEDLANAAPRAVPVPGQEFGGYRILKLLGHGGMGEVYEAEQISSGRRVALKVMRHTLVSEQDRKRFLREGRLAAAVNHPNVVYIHGSEEIDGAPAIAMELVHGGTLKDRLKSEGPLPISDAVEATLHIIDGLEAAHSAGVLHRDIKPANCFVASDGTVKVGDFGLSVSTLARGESLITASGAVMGTPAYASPEQLRGEELDVTSDIYSVGATLYHLLTGKTPFNAQDFVKLITEVLDKQPAAPRSLRAEVPLELSKILLRCLAKDRKARFQSYSDLRDALLPFRASEMVPARPGVRFLAGLVDDIIAFGPSILFTIYWSVDALDKFSRERTFDAFLIWLPFEITYLVYYAIAEGIFGGGVGKTLCGLRVVNRQGQRAGIGRAALRVFIYSLTWTLPSLIAMLVYSKAAMQSALQQGTLWTEWAWLPLFILLFVTMRARNGFAAVHDLISGTRVIVRPKTQPRPALQYESPAALSPAPQKNIGPYVASGSLWKISNEELWLASDPALRRNVWIHFQSQDSPAISDARRNVSRAGRLRWINSGEFGAQRWNAYEALDGAPFLQVTQKPQPWRAVRFWLLDLAEECAAANSSPASTPPLALDHLWITSNGRAVLLDFSAPGTANEPASAAGEWSIQSVQKFLDAVASAALHGQATTRNTAALVPLHAQSFLTSLARGAFEEARYIVGNLQSLIARPAEVTKAKRFASLAFVPAITLFFAVFIIALIAFDQLRWSRDWAQSFPGRPSIRAAADLYADRVEEAERSEEDARNAKLVGAYIARHFTDVITNDAYWASPSRVMAATEVRPHLLHAVVSHSRADAETLAEAERSVPRWLAKRERGQRTTMLYIGSGMALMIVALAALVELAGALIFRMSPVLRLFGFAVVTRAGLVASRARLLARWALVWLPAGGALFLCVGLLFYLADVSPEAAEHNEAFVRGSAVAIIGVIILAADALALYAALRPHASIQDRLARTRLVPM